MIIGEIIVAIILGVYIFALIIFVLRLGNNSVVDFNIGVFFGAIITILIIIEIGLVANIIEEPTPSALDVYRGNTELEITSVNGTPIDTVVVFKKN
jgi:hypothetical protein